MRRTHSTPFGAILPKSSGGTRQIRRVVKTHNCDVPSPDEDIMIIDSACDQSMVHRRACKVLSLTGEYFTVEGAIDGMTNDAPLQVANVAVLVTDPYSKNKLICIINQCLLIDNEKHREALLQPHQARCFGTAIDDCAKHHTGVDGRPGNQCIKVPECTIPLLHDGWK